MILDVAVMNRRLLVPDKKEALTSRYLYHVLRYIRAAGTSVVRVARIVIVVMKVSEEW